MIKCVIIDDELPARESLKMLLNRYFSERVKVLGEAESLAKGMKLINKFHPDLVFLDIEMPGEDGFKIFDYYAKDTFSVVFTTAYNQYAIRAIKVAALDYILKPISYEALNDTATLFEKKNAVQSGDAQAKKLISAVEALSGNNGKIALPTATGFQLEKATDIVYCEAEQSYTWVHLINEKKILISRSLGTLEELLPKTQFYRIHKSHLVNMNYVKSYNKVEGLHVILENGIRLDVASRRKAEFIKVLMQHR